MQPNYQMEDGWMRTIIGDKRYKGAFPTEDGEISLSEKDAKDIADLIIKMHKPIRGTFKKPLPITMENGDVYFGNIVNGKKHGYGRCVYAKPKGRIYEGIFSHDARHGKGKCEYPNGDRYVLFCFLFFVLYLSSTKKKVYRRFRPRSLQR